MQYLGCICGHNKSQFLHARAHTRTYPAVSSRMSQSIVVTHGNPLPPSNGGSENQKMALKSWSDLTFTREDKGVFDSDLRNSHEFFIKYCFYHQVHLILKATLQILIPAGKII